MEQNNPNISYSYRLNKRPGTRVLHGLMIFCMALMVVLAVTSGSVFFYFVMGMFGLAWFANYVVFRKRAKYFLSDFKADNEKLFLSYYDGDTHNTVQIAWSDVDFYLGNLKSDVFMVIWKKNEVVFKIFQSFGNQEDILMRLRQSLLDHLPKERVTIPKFLFGVKMPNAYTKTYSGLW